MVCLEHGKDEPRAKIPYQIVPISEFTEDKSVHELCKMLGTGQQRYRVIGIRLVKWTVVAALAFFAVLILERLVVVL
jgi:hypothetical protein